MYQLHTHTHTQTHTHTHTQTYSRQTQSLALLRLEFAELRQFALPTFRLTDCKNVSKRQQLALSLSFSLSLSCLHIELGKWVATMKKARCMLSKRFDWHFESKLIKRFKLAAGHVRACSFRCDPCRCCSCNYGN